MTPEELKNRHVRKPKPESRINLLGYFYAYDKDGNFQGEVKLTNNKKKWYEERGFTFKRRN